MSFQQNQLDKHGIKIGLEKVSKIESGCIEYRRIVEDCINNMIKGLSTPMKNFDKVNYGLERAFKDGGASQLNLLKEIIKNV